MIDNFAKTFENLKRQSFRRSVNKVWNIVKEGQSIEMNQEEQEPYDILLRHQEYQDQI